MKKLILISVLATLAVAVDRGTGLPSVDVLASPTPCPTPAVWPSNVNVNADDQCLAVTEDVLRAEDVTKPASTAPFVGCNQHTMNGYASASCNSGRINLSGAPSACPLNGVCGAYGYTIFEKSSPKRLFVEQDDSRPVLTAHFQPQFFNHSNGAAYGFACLLLAATDGGGEFLAGTKRFVEYCFTQWKVGVGFPNDTPWNPGNPGANPPIAASGSLLIAGGYPNDGADDDPELGAATLVCAVGSPTATVDTVHVTYGSGPSGVVYLPSTSAFTRYHRVDSRYVNRALLACGRNTWANVMRVVGHKTGWEGGGFTSAEAVHQALALDFY
jgi:hypothetical protein